MASVITSKVSLQLWQALRLSRVRLAKQLSVAVDGTRSISSSKLSYVAKSASKSSSVRELPTVARSGSVAESKRGGLEDPKVGGRFGAARSLARWRSAGERSGRAKVGYPQSAPLKKDQAQI